MSIKSEAIAWVKDYFAKNGNSETKAVLGISGGKDSATVAALCCAALGKEPVTEGLLTGVFDFTEITGADKYVLQNQPEVDGVAFYPATDPTNAVLVSPNRAYLYIPETAVVVGAKAIRFPGADATGINTINVLTSGKAEIFNAAGARIPSLQKGVNIIRTADGKTSKVLVK